MTVLVHSYSGPGYPAYPDSEKTDGYIYDPEAELIGGAFRIVADKGALIVIGNGEDPERLWGVVFEAWEEGRG